MGLLHPRPLRACFRPKAKNAIQKILPLVLFTHQLRCVETQCSAGAVHFLRDLCHLRKVILSETLTGDESAESISSCRLLESLSVGDTRITDASLAYFANFELLRFLNLEKTSVTDAGASYLSGLKNLDTLSLCGTAVSDASIDTLLQLPRLENLYIDQSQMSSEGIERLQKARPELDISIEEDA